MGTFLGECVLVCCLEVVLHQSHSIGPVYGRQQSKEYNIVLGLAKFPGRRTVKLLESRR